MADTMRPHLLELEVPRHKMCPPSSLSTARISQTMTHAVYGSEVTICVEDTDCTTWKVSFGVARSLRSLAEAR